MICCCWWWGGGTAVWSMYICTGWLVPERLFVLSLFGCYMLWCVRHSRADKLHRRARKTARQSCLQSLLNAGSLGGRCDAWLYMPCMACTFMFHEILLELEPQTAQTSAWWTARQHAESAESGASLKKRLLELWKPAAAWQTRSSLVRKVSSFVCQRRPTMKWTPE